MYMYVLYIHVHVYMYTCTCTLYIVHVQYVLYAHHIHVHVHCFHVQLLQDSTSRYLKTDVLSVADKELINLEKPIPVESMANALHPLPTGGVLVIGGETLACYGSLHHAVDFPLLKVL